MCTYLTEKIALTGSAKGQSGWFRLGESTVYLDHPQHAVADHTLNIDFFNAAGAPINRVAVELTPASARELVNAINRALASAPAGLLD